MSRSEKFFRAMAWLCFGVLVGIFLAPVKNGVHISICSNNKNSSFGDDGADLCDEDEEDDEQEEIVLR
ncbi:hypothetical protein [Butyricicoccus sp.]|uniref:hypothetical protein n=1 Tax=Butyricicoccus sp. TaxID=2049021 RepID=UPI003D7E1670